MTKSKKQKSNSKSSSNNKNDVIPAPLPPRASAVESQPKTRSSAAESQPPRESAAKAEHEIRASAAEKKIDLDWMGSGFKPVTSSGSGGGINNNANNTISPGTKVIKNDYNTNTTTKTTKKNVKGGAPVDLGWMGSGFKAIDSGGSPGANTKVLRIYALKPLHLES